MKPIILASSSPYRRQLLDKLQLDYSCHKPAIDETPKACEKAHTLALRLASAKAHAVAIEHPCSLIIGSDQTADLDGEILGKPHNFNTALAQLTRCQGKMVIFYTGLSLLNTETGKEQLHAERYCVTFKNLNQAQLSHYLKTEQPYDCAGSFKVESYGITLFEKLEGRDPNSLIGLPLIKLTEFLLNESIDVLS